MTIIELSSFLDIRPDRLINWAKRKGKTGTEISEQAGFFKIEIKPDLTAGEKSGLQTELDKVGRGIIT